MSEQIENSREKAPILCIEGTLTLADYKRAALYTGISRLLITIALYCGAMLAVTIGLNISYGYPPFSFSFSKLTLIIISAFFLLYAVVILVYRPLRRAAILREAHRGAESYTVRYVFTDGSLRVEDNSATPPSVYEAPYDTIASFKELHEIIRLRTKARNYLALYKAVMTPQEQGSVLELLNERCAGVDKP